MRKEATSSFSQAERIVDNEITMRQKKFKQNSAFMFLKKLQPANNKKQKDYINVCVVQRK